MREPIAIAAWLLQLLHGEERHESLAENHLSRDDAQDNKPAHIRPGLVSSPSVPPSGSIIAPDTGLPHHPGLSRAQLARIRAQQAAEADGKETTLKDEHEAHKWHGYVAKPADGGKAWHDAYAHAAELVSQMTLEEKVRLGSRCLGLIEIGANQLGQSHLRCVGAVPFQLGRGAEAQHQRHVLR